MLGMLGNFALSPLRPLREREEQENREDVMMTRSLELQEHTLASASVFHPHDYEEWLCTSCVHRYH